MACLPSPVDQAGLDQGILERHTGRAGWSPVVPPQPAAAHP
jgi:hypothetical protein